MRPIDITGKQVGRLKIIEFSHRDAQQMVYWKCLCACGSIVTVKKTHLLSGSIKSCGCLRKETTKQRCTTHGKSSLPEYIVWKTMRQRCFNSKTIGVNYYKNRGITICKRWYSFKNFIKDMGSRPSNKHSIDRINNDRGYCKENCRWATSSQQNRNKRNNKLITYKGVSQCVAAWAKEKKINAHTLRQRLVNGWRVDIALESPPYGKNLINL